MEVVVRVLASLQAEWGILLQENVLFLLGVASFCGCLIGLERERAHKPAGLRTNMMICVGSCLYTLASLLIWKYISPASDPSRIAAQVVSGVGFLGAGVILKTGMHIIGITTASTIWLVAAVGMVIGLGFPLLGFLVTILAATTLFILGKFELSHPALKNHQG